MAENFILDKARFFEYGKPAPDGSRFRGLLDETALIGYYHYTEEKEKNERNTELQNIHEGGYLGYVNKDEYTFTSEGNGWLDQDNKKEFEDILKNAFKKNGDLWWEQILSFKSDEISRSYGLETVEDYKSFIERCMPKMCKAMHLDSNNVVWWANRHIDTTHTHVHLNFSEKIKTRTAGKMSECELRRMKNIVAAELMHFKEEKENIDREYKINIFKNKDTVYHELINAICKETFDKDIAGIHDLYNILPKDGRLSYNSFAMKPYRKAIDAVTEKILRDKEIRKYFDDYVHVLNRLNNYQNQMLSQSGEYDIANIKETELKKLYARIGNLIVTDFKKKTVKKYTSPNQYPIDKNNIAISKMKQVPSQRYGKNYEYIFTINRSLLLKEYEDFIFVRIPNTKAQKYMYLDKNRYVQLSDQTGKYTINSDEQFMIYDKLGNQIERIDTEALMTYWDDKTKIVFNTYTSENKKANVKIIPSKKINRSDSAEVLYEDTKLYRKKKTVGDYKRKIRRWLKMRNLSISDSELYKDMYEWEKANGIKHL